MNFFFTRIRTEIGGVETASRPEVVDGRWKIEIRLPVPFLPGLIFTSLVQFHLDKRSGSDCAAGVTRGGRQIHFLEWRSAINFAVRHRIHRATTGQGEIVARMLFVERLKQREKSFL